MSFEPVVLRFAAPVYTAFGSLERRELLRVRLRSSDGIEGVGEAGPLGAYDGVSLRTVHQALTAYADVLGNAPEGAPGDRYSALRDTADVPQALAAVDLALWDIAGRRAGRPVCELLAENAAQSVEVNATISAHDRAGAAAAAAQAAADGFRTIKCKVGIGDDAGRVVAVRAAAGPETKLRLDANGAWDVETAVATIEALAPVGLELVEEPVHGIAALRAVRERVPVRIAMDETADAGGALLSGAADAVCLKLSRCGGISGLLAAAQLVRASGSEVYVASTFDGPHGIAGALHAVAALAAKGPMAACGLATLGLFENVVDPFPPRDGSITTPTGPGLGVPDL